MRKDQLRRASASRRGRIYKTVAWTSYPPKTHSRGRGSLVI